MGKAPELEVLPLGASHVGLVSTSLLISMEALAGPAHGCDSQVSLET